MDWNIVTRQDRAFGRWMGLIVLIVAIGVVWANPSAVGAEEKIPSTPDTAEETINNGLEEIIDLLQQKGIVNAQEAAEIKARMKRTGEALNEAQENDQSKVVPKATEKELEAEIRRLEEKLDRQLDHVQTDTRLNAREIDRLDKERIDSLVDKARKSAWAQRVSLSGDIRLRYQKDFFDESNALLLKPGNLDEVMNTTEDRERFRARARLGLKANIIDPREINVGKVDVGLRLATGNNDDPVSTNETLGDAFNKDSIVFDRYYLRWRFEPLLPIWGRIPQINLTVGRMPNPWFSSDMVWDDDLNFEGVTFSFKTDTQDYNGWHLFLTGGAYPLEEVELSSDDKWLYAGQLGFAIRPFYGFDFTLGTAYYYFRNITGKFNDPSQPGLLDYTAPQFQQKGNTLIDIDPSSDILTALAAEFKVIDVTAEMDFSYFFPVHIILNGSYLKNLGFDQDDVSRRVGSAVVEDTEAYGFGIKVGYPKIYNFGEWNFFFQYKYIGADAVVDAFNDSDFHLGGTNAKGWLAGLELGLYRNVWLRTRWITSDEIEPPQIAIDTFQFDINARF